MVNICSLPLFLAVEGNNMLEVTVEAEVQFLMIMERLFLQTASS